MIMASENRPRIADSDLAADVIPEPGLLFGHGQSLHDPRDGITLFGPLDQEKDRQITWGCIGTKDGIRRAISYIRRLRGLVVDPASPVARPYYPGFEAAFRVPLGSQPLLRAEVSGTKLRYTAYLDDPHQRVYATVSEYTDTILDVNRTSDHRPDVWIVVIPDFIHSNCRPQSRLSIDVRTQAPYRFSKKSAQELLQQRPLFAEETEQAKPYYFDLDFHHQLKARLLSRQIATQIVRETTIAPAEFADSVGRPKRDLSGMESSVAWNIATALYYKSGFRPWKLATARDGVCYIGVAFKQVSASSDRRTACCAAQMFLDSGDGLVFRGAVGPWFAEKRGDFHLSKKAAAELMETCIKGYQAENGGRLPGEVFLHGRVAFGPDEWNGFQAALPTSVKAVGVKIRRTGRLKLYRLGSHPVLRGTAVGLSAHHGFLWTSGMIPRIATYDGREVPNPLEVDITNGEANLKQVMEDILGLTKLNYNACKHSDGSPVTLRFADDVGDLLTAIPLDEVSQPPLPFKFYI